MCMHGDLCSVRNGSCVHSWRLVLSEELKLCISIGRLVFSKELKLCTWRLVVSEHTSTIILYRHSFNSSLNTRLHIQSFSNSSMTTSQHVNIQLQFSACSEV